MNSPLSRRSFLRNSGIGFGMVALASMLERDGLLGAPVSNLKSQISNPLAPQRSHFPAKAKSVIFLFMSGGPSHVDLFDPKPDLVRLAGQPIPESFGTFKTRRAVAKNTLMPPLRPFAKHGECGMEVSGLLPNIAKCVDHICLLRGCHGDSHCSSVSRIIAVR